VGVLLGTAAGEDVGPAAAPRRAGVREEPRRAPQLGDGHPCDALHALRPPRGQAGAQLVDAVDPLREVVPVDQTLGPQDLGEAQQQDEVGAGQRAEMQAATVGGEGSGRRAPGVDDDQPARLLRPGQVGAERRHRLGGVGPHEQDGARPVEIGERERQPAVQPEGPAPAGGS
jgi:hypothetical protein